MYRDEDDDKDDESCCYLFLLSSRSFHLSLIFLLHLTDRLLLRKLDRPPMHSTIRTKKNARLKKLLKTLYNYY